MRHDSGFTLLEVLVAMAILAVAITTMLQLSAQSLRLLGLSGEHQRAVLLADRVTRESQPEIEGVESGQEGPYAWERRVSLVALPAEQSPPTAAAPRLFSVAVSVRWGGSRWVEIATLRTSVEPQGSRLR
jgi:general secretion pathway protein I